MRDARQAVGGQLGDAAAAAETFERSRLAVADGAFRREADVADFTCVAAGAFIELSVEDEAAAHARPMRQIDHVACAFSCSELPFRESAGVRVVHQISCSAKTSCEFVDDFDMIPSGQVRRGEDDAFRGVERAAAGNAEYRAVARLEGIDDGVDFRKRRMDVRGGELDGF